MSEDGTFDVLPKKEVIALKKEWEKLEKNLNDVDTVSLCVDVGSHLRIPSSCLMSEMNTCF